MRANLIINESNQIAAKYVRNLNFHDMEDNFTISKKKKQNKTKQNTKTFYATGERNTDIF